MAESAPTSYSFKEKNKMRLTKRQLKRIIREEYTRLKRRGLIREMGEMDHEQDEFLAEQLAQYGDDFMQAAAECVMQGYMEQEDNPDSNSPESAAANAVMFYGQDSSGPESVMTFLLKCSGFSLPFHHMREEQKSMFGMAAPRHQVVDMMVDLGLADEIIDHCQAQIGG